MRMSQPDREPSVVRVNDFPMMLDPPTDGSYQEPRRRRTMRGISRLVRFRYSLCAGEEQQAGPIRFPACP